MSSASYTAPTATEVTTAQAIVDALLKCGITSGFGIPSIHNIALYDALRQEPRFHHWVVRHEQAGVFAADSYYRASGKTAVIFASTGPGNLFTVAPLLESYQTSTPVIVIGSNVASKLLGKPCGALHETPHQIEIFRPLTRFAARITSPGQIAETISAAAQAGGPAFVEIPHDVMLAPTALSDESSYPKRPAASVAPEEIAKAAAQIQQSRKPVIVVGSDVIPHNIGAAVLHLAESLQAPVLTTTSGKGAIADDHALAMGCFSRLGITQDLLLESDLLISIGARFTEFDTGRFSLRVPAQYIQIEQDLSHVGWPFPFTCRLVGDLARIAESLTGEVRPRQAWWNVAGKRAEENERMQALHAEPYEALAFLRNALDRDDVVVNDQSILNYWASAFFPVLSSRSFIYPTGSGTLGYGLPAGVGAACAATQSGRKGRIVCISGDGGFQYTSHELATLARYQLPVKILLVNDSSYGIIGYLQRNQFGHTHEVELKNPDFCALANAYGVSARHVSDLDGLRREMTSWLNSPGPALLEWRTQIKAPWETGAIHRPR